MSKSDSTAMRLIQKLATQPVDVLESIEAQLDGGAASGCVESPRASFTPPPGCLPALLTFKALAWFLSMSEPTLLRREQDGCLPEPIRFERIKFWRTSEVQDWVNKGCPSREEWAEAKRK